MIIDANSAVVDNDFLSHITESNLDDTRLVAVLKTVFLDLGLTAVMHPLVFDNELLRATERVMLLFHREVVYKAEFPDIFQGDSGKKEYYIFLVTQMYKSLTGKSFPVSGNDVLTFWIRRNSLGEVHSIAMCLVCGCSIFLSDDNDSKRLKAYIDRMAIGNINVLNRNEFIQKHMLEGENKLSRAEKRSLTHAI